jgi:hypothetical protein
MVPVWTGGRGSVQWGSRPWSSAGEEERLGVSTGEEERLRGTTDGTTRRMVVLDDRLSESSRLRSEVGDGVRTSERSARSEAGAEVDGLSMAVMQ